MVKNLPAKRKAQVQSLGQEDPLEESMETHPGILAWRIPWTEEPGGLQSMRSQRVRHDRATLIALSSILEYPLLTKQGFLFFFSFAAVKHLVISQSIFKLSNND